MNLYRQISYRNEELATQITSELQALLENIQSQLEVNYHSHHNFMMKHNFIMKHQ